MKKGKIILGVAALAATITGAFAFKMHSNGRHQLVGTLKIGASTVCTVLNCWTNGNGSRGLVGHCKTASGGNAAVHTYLTKTTTGGKCRTALPTNLVVTINS